MFYILNFFDYRNHDYLNSMLFQVRLSKQLEQNLISGVLIKLMNVDL